MVHNYSHIKRALLRELSDDSRMSVTMLAKKLKCSRNTIISNMKALDHEFGLKYTLEFNNVLPALQNQIWPVRFDVKPSLEELREIFKDDGQVRWVAKTEGDFDLLISVAATSSESYISWGMKTLNKLIKFKPEFEASHILTMHMGFMSLREEHINNIQLPNIKLDDLDKKILLLLNENSRMNYPAIAKKLKKDPELVRYRIKRFLRIKLIKRFTTLLAKPPPFYTMAFFMKLRFSPGFMHRYQEAYNYYLNADRKLPIVNKFQFFALTSGTYFLFCLGCFESEEMAVKEAIIAHKSIYKEDNPSLPFAKVTDVVKGYLPIRSMDFSKEYKPLDIH